MTTLETTDIRRSLVRKGAIPENTDHFYFRKYLDGQLVVLTKVSHGCRQIDDYLIGKMARQCGVPKAQFVALVRCTFTEDDWDSVLRAQEH